MPSNVCRRLYEAPRDLFRLGPDDFGFAATWIRRFHAAGNRTTLSGSYPWVTFNAWAARRALSRNHIDSYLIRCVAGSERFRRRFDSLMERNRHFRRCVENLCELGPVAKVRWLRNSGIPQWDMQLESRADYIYSIAYDLERAGQPRPFSPQCALDHFYAGEDIPADWPHVLSMIYQIRCNLFHGGKDYDSTQDRRFIKLAQRILWEMWRPEIPPGTQRMGNLTRGRSRSRTGRQTLAPAMLWERALVISGFVFEPLAGGFDLSQENEGNVEYRDLLVYRLRRRSSRHRL